MVRAKSGHKPPIMLPATINDINIPRESRRAMYCGGHSAGQYEVHVPRRQSAEQISQVRHVGAP